MTLKFVPLGKVGKFMANMRMLGWLKLKGEVPSSFFSHKFIADVRLNKRASSVHSELIPSS